MLLLLLEPSCLHYWPARHGSLHHWPASNALGRVGLCATRHRVSVRRVAVSLGPRSILGAPTIVERKHNGSTGLTTLRLHSNSKLQTPISFSSMFRIHGWRFHCRRPSPKIAEISHLQPYSQTLHSSPKFVPSSPQSTTRQPPRVPKIAPPTCNGTWACDTQRNFELQHSNPLENSSSPQVLKIVETPRTVASLDREARYWAPSARGSDLIVGARAS